MIRIKKDNFNIIKYRVSTFSLTFKSKRDELLNFHYYLAKTTLIYFEELKKQNKIENRTILTQISLYINRGGKINVYRIEYLLSVSLGRFSWQSN